MCWDVLMYIHIVCIHICARKQINVCVKCASMEVCYNCLFVSEQNYSKDSQPISTDLGEGLGAWLKEEFIRGVTEGPGFESLWSFYVPPFLVVKMGQGTVYWQLFGHVYPKIDDLVQFRPDPDIDLDYSTTSGGPHLWNRWTLTNKTRNRKLPSACG